MFKKIFFSFIIISSSISLFAQEEDRKISPEGSFSSRYMSTNNKGQLEDFNALVFFGNVGAEFQANSRLTFSTQIYGLLIPNTSGIAKRDAITGSGPIYEANLFNLRTMDGNSEFSLPVLNAQIELEGQVITIGRFLKTTPTIRAEPWPFPDALEGVWYENYRAQGTSWQLGLIYRIAPRFSGQFETIGTSIGVAGTGIDSFGNTSGYRDNVNSDFLVVGNYKKQFSHHFSIDLWNYFVEGVTNTFYAEPNYQLLDMDLNISAMGILQTKVGNGGNANPSLTYQFDDSALYLGLRLEKRQRENTFQLNFSRISDDGRLLLPREWGLEPFYTFQRRTRIEGFRDVSSVMFKWQREWSNDFADFRLFSSLGKNELADVNDAPRNKYYTPSHIHWDWDIQIKPTQWMKGLSAEIYSAYRFLADDTSNNPEALINRANFYHFDFILNYSF